MSRTAFCPELGDLTGDGVCWTTYFDPKIKVIVHDMRPDPKWTIYFLFVIQPIQKNLILYTQMLGKHRKGKRQTVIGHDFIGYLKALAKHERSQRPELRRLNLSDTELRTVINLLQNDVTRELEKKF